MATGTKDIQEAITAAVALIAAAREAGVDGYQLDDLGILVTDEGLQAAILSAVQGATTIPDEVQDLSFGEGLELAAHVVAQLEALA